MLCFFVALFPGAGVGCPLLSSRASGRRLRAPPPLLLGLRTSLYRPNQRKTLAMGDCYILCGRSSVTCSAWAVYRPLCERFLFAAGCSMKELSKSTVSFWFRMPLSWVCRLSVTERSVLCPLSSVHSYCHSVSFLRKPLLSSWWKGEVVALALILARLLLRGSCPSVPRGLPPVLCGGGAGLVLPGPARLDISLLTTWRLVLRPCFLVRSPTTWRLVLGPCFLVRFSYHPPPSHGISRLVFMYVSTFWNVVCIISWKYWITFLQNLSFLLK